jgi:hypothetical protein
LWRVNVAATLVCFLFGWWRRLTSATGRAPAAAGAVRGRRSRPPFAATPTAIAIGFGRFVVMPAYKETLQNCLVNKV